MFSLNLCKVCLIKEKNLTNTSVVNEGETSINDLLFYCVPEIDWNKDTIPPYICGTCIQELNTSVKFRRKCLESDTLRQNDLQWRTNDVQSKSLNIEIADELLSKLDVKSVTKKKIFTPVTKSKDRKLFNCSQCQKQFQSFRNYKIHVGKAHKVKHKKKATKEKGNLGQETHKEQSKCIQKSCISKENHCAEKNLYKEVNIENEPAVDCKDKIVVNYEFSDYSTDKNNSRTICENNENEVKQNINSEFQAKFFPTKKDKKCKICLKEFTKTTTLMNHFRSMHSFENCFKCTHCDEAFPNKERLVRHENHHTGVRKYICSICGKKFFTSSDLFHHNERHAGDRKFKCDICNIKSFTTRNNLRTHKKIVHTDPEEWKFLCTNCGRKFVTQGALNVHMKRHGDRKEFPCSVCDKGFCTKAELVKHLKAHSDQREFKCQVCGQQYKLKEILERHLFKKHGIGDKVFPERIKKHLCPVCPLKFCSRLQIEKHLRAHNGERPFKCSYCSHSFICSSYLKGHIKNKHPAHLLKEENDSKDRILIEV
ncbi:gastrula zinc finger protein XlCGF26.1-like [Agrilus planipennis]|uniref:Gastrula zinc finger protein XlCGF26.1-like n=1 Tax=Agrilus planipennis TaxID=224129 RepID=A0A1W4X1H7_AGRPL|nr:gastrula zinc finger protein XlCGF26.1-like [Agrilus planipennis]